MDWSKAKTILIVAFLITNILLAINLYRHGGTKNPSLEPEFIERSLKLLEAKGIKVDTEIPLIQPSLEPLVVEYENFKNNQINGKFFENRGVISLSADGILEIYRDKEKVTLINNRLIIYERLENKGENKFLLEDENTAVEKSIKFLEERGFSTEDMTLSHIRREENTYILEFSKVHEGRYLESSFTNLQIDEFGVKRLDRLWLNVIAKGEKPIYISSAPKSILSLLNISRIEGKTIDEISLCYYFDPTKHDYIEELEQAKQGRAVPAWRIKFTDGEKIFIDQYQ